MLRWMLLVFLGACSYGILSTFVKLAYGEGFVVQDVVGSQMFLGAVMLWALALFALRQKQQLSGKTGLYLLIAGVPAGLTGVLYYVSLQYIPASLAIVLLFQFTWMGVLIDAVLERKWPGKEKLLALLLLVIGTLLAGGVFEQDLHELPLMGLLFGFLSAISYSMTIYFSGKAAPHVNFWVRSAVMTTGSMLIVFLIFPPAFFVNGSLTHGLLPYSLLLSIFGAVIPPLLFNLGIPRIGVGLGTILGAAELPTAVIMSSLLLSEHVSLLQWIGVVIILLGVAIPEMLNRWQNQRKNAGSLE
ncbi:UNVERIFIED_CONTAM: drug/metabolite transporter (DMT)-like permease [Brevibacillus sp. OAP136]